MKVVVTKQLNINTQQLPYCHKIIQGKLFDAGFVINSTVKPHIFTKAIADILVVRWKEINVKNDFSLPMSNVYKI